MEQRKKRIRASRGWIQGEPVAPKEEGQPKAEQVEDKARSAEG